MPKDCSPPLHRSPPAAGAGRVACGGAVGAEFLQRLRSCGLEDAPPVGAVQEERGVVEGAAGLEGRVMFGQKRFGDARPVLHDQHRELGVQAVERPGFDDRDAAEVQRFPQAVRVPPVPARRHDEPVLRHL